MRIGAIIVCLLLGVLLINGQNAAAGGIMPRINLSTRLNTNNSLKGSIESRQELFDQTSESGLQYRYVLTDYSLFFSHRLAADYSLNVGYMIRTRGGRIFHRFSQHLNIVQRLDRGRIGHRMATDQTITTDNPTVVRFRYRATLEQGLSGERIDAREFYYKLGTELLYIFSSAGNELEWRLVPLLGFELTAKSKVEAGIDYRLQGLFQEGQQSRYWLRLSWFHAI